MWTRLIKWTSESWWTIRSSLAMGVCELGGLGRVPGLQKGGFGGFVVPANLTFWQPLLARQPKYLPKIVG